MIPNYGPQFYPGTMQDPRELAWFLELIQGKGSMLEIGSGSGGNLFECAGVLKSGAVLRSISTTHIIMERFDSEGYDCVHALAPSQYQSVLDWAKQWAPYDVLFIDGDHSYEGCMADWEMYHPLASLVAFHDISGNEEQVACKRVWREVCAFAKSQGWKIRERIADPTCMGIGVIIK